MATGKNIKDVGVGRVIGSMKIPVGGAGNAAITPRMLQDSFNQQSSIYITDNPAIVRLNGLTQDLRLNKNGVLTFDGAPAQSVFLRVSGNFSLDISGFRNVNNYVRNPEKNSFISVINWNGMLLLYGVDYVGSHIDPIDPTNPPITCESATSAFTYHTDLDTTTIEYSVDDGPWLPESMQPKLSITAQPQYGVVREVALSEGETLARVRVRFDRSVALYNNPVQSINDTDQPNQSYTLYNSSGTIIDPRAFENKVYDSSYIDDTSTDLDYCVFFNEVSFCLTNVIPLSCEGAIGTINLTVKMDRSEFNSTFTIYDATTDEIITQSFGYYYMDGEDFKSQLHLSDEWLSRVEIVSTAPTEYPTDEFSLTGHIQIRVLDGSPLRIKVDATSPYGVNPERTYLTDEMPSNPTLIWNTNDEVLGRYNLSVCLNGTSLPLGCEGSINSFKGQLMTDGGTYQTYIDGVGTDTTKLFRDDLFKNLLSAKGVILNAYDSSGNLVLNDGTGHYNNAEVGEFINLSGNYVQIRIEVVDASAIDTFLSPVNDSSVWDSATGTLTFCLAPNANPMPMGCEGSTNSTVIQPTGTEYSIRVSVDGTQVVDVFGPDTGAIRTALLAQDIDYNDSTSIIVNKGTEYKKVVFQAYRGDVTPNLYVDQIEVQDLANHTISVKVSSADQLTLEDSVPNTTDKFAEISFCLAPPPPPPLGCEGSIPTGTVYFTDAYASSFGIKVFVDGNLITETTDCRPEDIDSIRSALQEIGGIQYYKDDITGDETLLNLSDSYRKVIFQTGNFSGTPTYIQGMGTGGPINPTVKLKVPSSDGLSQVDYPAPVGGYYSEVSYCLAPHA